MTTFRNYLGGYRKKMVRSYNFLSFMLISKRWDRLDFLNLGFVGYKIPFEPEEFDKNSLDSISLYCKTLDGLPDTAKSALEIGSGLGGGCYLLMKYFKIKEVVGIDYAKLNVRYSLSKFSELNINYINLPAEESIKLNRKFDLILSLEASQLFYSWEKFIENIPKLLTDNGSFFYADLFTPEDIINIEHIISSNGLKIKHREDISEGVSKAISKIKKPEKDNMFVSVIKKILLIKVVEKFHAYNNSDFHKRIINKEFIYMKYVITK